MDSLQPPFDISKIPVRPDTVRSAVSGDGNKPFDPFSGIGEFKKQPNSHRVKETVRSLTAAAGISLAALAGIGNMQSADAPKPPPIVSP